MKHTIIYCIHPGNVICNTPYIQTYVRNTKIMCSALFITIYKHNSTICNRVLVTQYIQKGNKSCQDDFKWTWEPWWMGWKIDGVPGEIECRSEYTSSEHVHK